MAVVCDPARWKLLADLVGPRIQTLEAELARRVAVAPSLVAVEDAIVVEVNVGDPCSLERLSSVLHAVAVDVVKRNGLIAPTVEADGEYVTVGGLA